MLMGVVLNFFSKAIFRRGFPPCEPLSKCLTEKGLYYFVKRVGTGECPLGHSPRLALHRQWEIAALEQ